MKISRLGGIIGAASETAAFPLQKVGNITAVKRIVLTFQQAGVFPIVVVTGCEEEEVRRELSAYGVVFIHAKEGESPELFEAVKAGLLFLQEVCDRVVFSPVNTPFFLPETLALVAQAEGELVIPSYQNKSGHPVVISGGIIPPILDYAGEKGLRGAMAGLENLKRWVVVEDGGVLCKIVEGVLPPERGEACEEVALHPRVRMELRKEHTVFNSRVKLLLLLLTKTGSVRAACEKMALSYSKAWEMLNTLEEALGYEVVKRRHGGKQGGRTDLTKQGFAFLVQYQKIEENVFEYSRQQFHLLMKKDDSLL